MQPKINIGNRWVKLTLMPKEKTEIKQVLQIERKTRFAIKLKVLSSPSKYIQFQIDEDRF